jgi:hypothetical protein
MRIKKPRRASRDEVRISRSGEEAIITFSDPTISTTHLRIGPQVDRMSDQAIIDMFNDIADAQDQLLAEWENIVIEIPPGKPQIKYSDFSDQWIPRGDLLRCHIDDRGPEGEVTVHIDDKELSLREFGRLLSTHAGWGMRIAFVPSEIVEEEPEIEVREPNKGER